MIPEWVHTVLLVLLMVAVLAAVAFMKAGETGRQRRLGLRGVPVSFALMGLVYFGGTHVYVVTGAGDARDVLSRRLWWRSSWQMSSGRTVGLEAPESGGLIVNDTDDDVWVERREYGRSMFGGLLPSTERVPPDSVGRGPSSIDYLGPDDVPPPSLSVQRGTSWKIVHHLTWSGGGFVVSPVTPIPH